MAKLSHSQYDPPYALGSPNGLASYDLQGCPSPGPSAPILDHDFAMRKTRLIAWLLPMLAGAACATGTTEGDDDDGAPTGIITGTGTGAGIATGTPTGTATGSSGGWCYDGDGECNPLSGSCEPGEACDIADDFQFHCFPAPNDVPVGGSCDPVDGPFCVPGATCLEGSCAAYCCQDNDCLGNLCASAGTAGTVEIFVCN